MDSGRVQLRVYHSFFQLNGCILVIVCFCVRAYLGNLAWMGNCFLISLVIGKGFLVTKHVSMLRIHNVYFDISTLLCSL